jgi:hypothetical protein
VRQDLPAESHEPGDDPVLGTLFLGGYIEVFPEDDTTLVYYNATYVQAELLGKGIPVSQQDTFLLKEPPLP